MHKSTLGIGRCPMSRVGAATWSSLRSTVGDRWRAERPAGRR
jgi:hypothetical protein